jgi:hypothetical protein
VDPGELRIDEPWPKSHVDADQLPFYPMLRGRLAAREAMHRAMVQQRLEQSIPHRARTDDEINYKVGDLVEWRSEDTKKDRVPGWRGPVAIYEMPGEGRVVFKWQDRFEKIPVRNIRPHIPLNAFVAPDFLERVYNIEAHDAEPLLQINPNVNELMHKADGSAPGAMSFHFEDDRGKRSQDAQNDDGHVFGLARDAALRMHCKSYRGCRLFRAKDAIQAVPGIARQLVVLWPTGDHDGYVMREITGAAPVKV